MRDDSENHPSGDASTGAAAPDFVRLVFESMAEGLMVVDEQGAFLVFNREAERLLGPPPHGAAPSQWSTLFGARLHDGVTPCSADAFPLWRAMRGESVREAELAVGTAEPGHAAWIRGSAQPLVDGTGRVCGGLMVFRDVSARKQADAALLAERARLAQQFRRQASLAAIELTINKISELRTLLDRVSKLTEQLLPSDGACISICDTRVSRLLESTRTESAPSHAIEQLHQHHGAFQWIIEHRRPLAVSDVRDEPFAPTTVLSAAGVQAYAGVPLLDSGQVLGVLFATADRVRHFEQEDLDFMTALANRAAAAVTKVRLYGELEQHREHLEHLVRERTVELEASHRRLRLADRLASIGTLTAGLGHDMNNVLFPVRCRLDALDWTDLPADARKTLETVSHSVGYLQQLSDGLRLFALDPEDAEASADSTDLSAWWPQVRPLLEQSIHGVRLDAELDASLPAVRVAPHRLTQAVLNLLVNAGEAAGGGARIRLRAGPAADGTSVRIAVSDDGPGMSPEVREQAFDPFFTTKPRGLSTGLGLSLVHGVVAASGGTIEVESAEAAGTTVIMTFPVDDDGAALETGGLGPADVGVQDALGAAWVTRLLRERGFEPRSSAAPGSDAALWVTEPRDGQLEAARAFLARRPEGRVVVLGDAPTEWADLGAIVIDAPGKLDALRSGIRAAAEQVGDNP